MSKEARREKIQQLEERLGSRVICFLTSDRPKVDMQITRDCLKILQHHISAGEKHERLSLYIVSHGGDLDVPWDLVNFLRAHCKFLQAVIPYVCHSAATMIALGCQEIVAGPRAQLSPTDPTVHVRMGTDENAPEMRFGVEDINAFVGFIRETLAHEFSTYGHEALNKLIDRVQPELLGSIKRTDLRIRLLIDKMLTLAGRKLDRVARKRVTSLLTVAYYSHGHFISRDEIRKDLKLPVVDAEEFKADTLIWELYEEYAKEFESRRPFDIQALAHNASANPLNVELKGKYIESMARTDLYVQTISVARGGAPSFNFTVPQVQGVPPQILQQVIQHFMGELNTQLQPFLVAKKLVSFGEWKTE
jgi:ATP-dependent protease ClpP protease subunit